MALLLHSRGVEWVFGWTFVILWSRCQHFYFKKIILPPPPDYQNVSPYSICQETNQYPPESYRNDSKSEDNTLKNGIGAPTLRYSGDERLWKATEACGWENISSVTGRLMSQLFFWLILFSTRGTMQCCQSSLSIYCIVPPHQKTPQNCISLLIPWKQGTRCAGQSTASPGSPDTALFGARLWCSSAGTS